MAMNKNLFNLSADFTKIAIWIINFLKSVLK